ncbi:hypothetical protein C8Q73DRAFT_2146 [Cubamyces lactineus]|nr:hypothetical protein C8Q73DRAFT_2146 [Cubamyces lactineus]
MHMSPSDSHTLVTSSFTPPQISTLSSATPSSSSEVDSAISGAPTIISSSSNADDNSESPSNHKHTVMVAVASVCGVLGALAIFLALAYCRLRKRSRSYPTASSGSPETPTLAPRPANERSEGMLGQQFPSLLPPPHVDHVDAISQGSREPMLRSQFDTDYSGRSQTVLGSISTHSSSQPRAFPSPLKSDGLWPVEEGDASSRTYITSESTLLETSSMHATEYARTSRPPSYYENA